MNTKEIISIAIALPVEERAMILNSILQSLNQPSQELGQKWSDLTKRRLLELTTGKVKPLPGEEVFHNIRRKFENK